MKDHPRQEGAQLKMSDGVTRINTRARGIHKPFRSASTPVGLLYETNSSCNAFCPHPHAAIVPNTFTRVYIGTLLSGRGFGALLGSFGMRFRDKSPLPRKRAVSRLRSLGSCLRLVIRT